MDSESNIIIEIVYDGYEPRLLDCSRVGGGEVHPLEVCVVLDEFVRAAPALQRRRRMLIDPFWFTRLAS